MPISSHSKGRAAGLLAGATLAAAWLVPGTTICAILGWIAAFFLIQCLRFSNGKLTPFYLVGLVSNAIAFHWLLGTIQTFGNFPYLAALGIFTFFVIASSVQYLIVAFLYPRLPALFDRLYLRATLSWVAGEMLSIRIFPWHLGHTQLAFSPFAQSAELGGAVLVSFLLMWIIEGFVIGLRNFFREKNLSSFFKLSTPITIFAATILFGVIRLESFRNPEGLHQPFALVQGNVSLEEKHNVKYFSTNEERYHFLTEPFVGSNTIVVWPESVIQRWIPALPRSTASQSGLPVFSQPTALLVGSLGYASPKERFNSAFAIYPDGTVPAPYHKRILMPFGEYIPFSGTFPILKGLNEMGGEFTAGRKVEVFQYPMQGERTHERNNVLVSPLICYEDLLPSLSREAVHQGAEILVNITNDAWFGDTVAPYQHHLIAAWRAIETRRYLLRSTNTGLTATVSPTGETIAELPTFREETLLADTVPLRYKTLYCMFGDLPWWIIAFTVALIAISRRRSALSKV